MPRRAYTYVFGYETPAELASNRSAGTDFESSAVLRIIAESEQSALAWGEELSEWYVALLFQEPRKSWKAENFARWIDLAPDESLRQAAALLDPVEAGDYPEFARLRSALGD